MCNASNSKNKIENLRQELNLLTLRAKDLTSIQIINTSQKLDEALNNYHKVNK
ncbi:aspartyl-phosphate phosphatase Spo0E family protein [Alkaliphilus metalliredigens]|uniref:aspartyl-phosphate phosphatase Spo0E family protein n=1 Tax=Alkaliphilus metalliredigens TaxID=208226 RepID=UPI00031FDE82